MKTPIAVALIIMGGLLVMTPPLSDYLYQRNVVAVLSDFAGETGTVTLDGKMGSGYRMGCWLTGSIMIGVAVICSLPVRRETLAHQDLRVTQAA